MTAKAIGDAASCRIGEANEGIFIDIFGIAHREGIEIFSLVAFESNLAYPIVAIVFIVESKE